MSKIQYSIVIGVTLSNALGCPAQFELKSERKKDPVVDMGKYMDEYRQLRSWGEKLTGLCSGITSLTLCLAVSLLGGGQSEKLGRDVSCLTG